MTRTDYFVVVKQIFNIKEKTVLIFIRQSTNTAKDLQDKRLRIVYHFYTFFAQSGSSE
jgi:hypothetical protein